MSVEGFKKNTGRICHCLWLCTRFRFEWGEHYTSLFKNKSKQPKWPLFFSICKTNLLGHTHRRGAGRAVKKNSVKQAVKNISTRLNLTDALKKTHIILKTWKCLIMAHWLTRSKDNLRETLRLARHMLKDFQQTVLSVPVFFLCNRLTCMFAVWQQRSYWEWVRFFKSQIFLLDEKIKFKWGWIHKKFWQSKRQSFIPDNFCFHFKFLFIGAFYAKIYKLLVSLHVPILFIILM